MKILRLLNNFKFPIIAILSFLFNLNVMSNEPEDIWNIKENNDSSSKEIFSDDNVEKIETDEEILEKKENDLLFTEENLDNAQNPLIGLYDPEENNLTIDMWKYSDGDQVKSILKKIFSLNLSKDADNILNIALMTNSYNPKKKINFQEFTNLKLQYLQNKNDLDLIKKFLKKNEKIKNGDEIIKIYLDNHILNGNIKEGCKLFEEIKINISETYLEKFKIYCYLNDNRVEEAILYYDLKKELGFQDEFFENKFNFLTGYGNENSEFSEKDILSFHLSHRTIKDFQYTVNNKTPKFIWKYLYTYNLLEQIDDIDLENENKIITIEKATHDKNFSEKELMNLYKRFQFDFEQLLNIKDTYKYIPNHKARAALYQRLLLTYDIEEKLFYAKTIKDLMRRDNISKAFNFELSNILKQIDEDKVPSNFTKFYEENIIVENNSITKIKINNKIIHQSKLLNYFENKSNIEKISKDSNDLLKKIKSKKNYVFSNKDKMLLDSIISDGADIRKNYQDLYDKDPNIPTDLQVLINNDDTGMLLLRLVEIIGEDKIEDLGTETLYFIIAVLNEKNLDQIRDNILLKVLPLKA